MTASCKLLQRFPDSLPWVTSSGALLVTWRLRQACITIALLGAHLPCLAEVSRFMGQRREPRKAVILPVRIFGTDAHGRPFSENVSTLNVSRDGTALSGVKAEIKVGEIIGLSYGKNKGRFRVAWVGQPATPHIGRVGLINVSPEKPLWEFPLPEPALDEFSRHSMGSDRRRQARLKCVNSVELHQGGAAAPIWGKAVDLSVGGCFVEMPIPLPVAPNSNLDSGSRKPSSGPPPKSSTAGPALASASSSPKCPPRTPAA